MDVEWYGAISTLLLVMAAMGAGYFAAVKAFRLETSGASAAEVERYAGRYVILWPLLGAFAALVWHLIAFWLVNGGEPRATDMLLELVFCRSKSMAERWITSGSYIGRSLVYLLAAFSLTSYATRRCLQRTTRPRAETPRNPPEDIGKKV